MTVSQTARFWIDHLELKPHPEGGFYREVYRSAEMIAASTLPQRFSGDRSFATSIYYLLERGDFSSFHRIASDETWHFYSGGPLELHTLNDNGHSVHLMGSGADKGESLQFTVEFGTWFAARPASMSPYSLVGCTVAPGFDFADLEFGIFADLGSRFPKHREVLRALCRDGNTDMER